MSVIQKIRDKYAVTIIVVICVAIASFLLQDAFFGKNSFMRRNTTAGKVNGVELDQAEYMRRIQIAENNMRSQYPNMDDQMRESIRERVWEEFLTEQIMGEQYKKLGIEATDAEVVDQFYGKTVNPIVAQQFSRNGVVDRDAIRNALSQGNSNPNLRESIYELQGMVAKYQQQLKYVTLIRQGIYYPKWLAKQDQADNSQIANISYVSVPYATISDSAVKVTTAELQRFIDEHKKLFEVEESRRVEFVSFDAIPSGADSAAAIQQIVALKQELDTTKEIAGFINRNSDIKYYDGYVSKNMVNVPQKDSIVNLPVGSTFGPYYDGNLIVYAKMVDRKNLPDSVKVRQIVIASGPQGGIPDSIAKKRADSIAVALRGGANFQELLAKYSDDPDKENNHGEGYITPTAQAFPEFKEFALEGANGEIKAVKTAVGYFVTQILEQKNIGPAIKVAYLGKSVDASKETNNTMFAAASDFASKAHSSANDFQNTIQKEKLNKRIADVRPMDFSVAGIGQARELVRWAYESKTGSVSNVFTFDDKYVVAVLTNVTEAGTAPLSAVRPQVEAEVKKHKKAEQIIAKLKSPASLEAAASSTNQPVLKAENVNFASPFVASLNFEPRVVGASFNKNWGTAKVSSPIEGNAGVFVIKVDNFQPSGQQPQDIATVQAAYEQNMRLMLDQQLMPALKKLSDVKDTRSKFF
ncbi:peptidyl-prolyl cis-trans isomerase D [Chitinophaga terrae (ex Kim and Jung 2007)]|uniref:peptidylprolyl isomerase n=1 Tax=Chitinophaga terrae (ex Kim and Jung 2007) TaxID=408074 RepID=UPI002785373E|nr:peptidylprolyl isomerase [Chitinophaga terrae (ex Kim and Jung 2007)]MDQ0105448.1 peptidyl-prolyl cis-trans isomerase D [Chitinophaga terrae (ex Kim and Jung 2007)]